MASVVRVIMASSVLASLVLIGYWRLWSDDRQKLIDDLTVLNERLETRLGEREQMIDRLGRTRRLAHIKVSHQEIDAAAGVTRTDLVFIELDETGAELARQPFSIPGDVLFVDAWTVKFDQERVAEGHPLFGRSLVLLRRIYSDRMAPTDGFPIDTPGGVPPGYATTEVGTFEQRVWADFWSIATDPDRARDMGVRVAQGEAVYKPVIQGRTYELLVDAVGGMSLRPLAPAEIAVTDAG